MKTYMRNVDELGRIVIPAEARAELGNPKAFNCTIDGDKLILTAAVPLCKLCGSEINVNKELGVCTSCIRKIKAFNP